MHACPPALHRIFLRSLLGFRPLIAPLCKLARQVFPQGEPLGDAADAMQRAASDLRDPGDVSRRRAFEDARDELAAALLEADAHGLFSDLIVADLIDLEAGRFSGLNMTVEAPPPVNLPFLLYVNTVRRNHVVLWAAAE